MKLANRVLSNKTYEKIISLENKIKLTNENITDLNKKVKDFERELKELEIELYNLRRKEYE